MFQYDFGFSLAVPSRSLRILNMISFTPKLQIRNIFLLT